MSDIENAWRLQKMFPGYVVARVDEYGVVLERRTRDPETGAVTAEGRVTASHTACRDMDVLGESEAPGARLKAFASGSVPW